MPTYSRYCLMISGDDSRNSLTGPTEHVVGTTLEDLVESPALVVRTAASNVLAQRKAPRGSWCNNETNTRYGMILLILKRMVTPPPTMTSSSMHAATWFFTSLLLELFPEFWRPITH